MSIAWMEYRKQILSQTFFTRYFEKPVPEENIIFSEVGRLRSALCQSLNCPRTRQRLTFEFRQDVFSFLFKKKGQQHGCWQVLEKHHFLPKYFPMQWDCLFDIHGQGTMVHFPVKIRHFISWSPPGYVFDTSGNGTEAPRAYQEKMSMDFIKVAAWFFL